MKIGGACKAYQSKMSNIVDAPIKRVLRGCNMQQMKTYSKFTSRFNRTHNQNFETDQVIELHSVTQPTDTDHLSVFSFPP